MMRSLALAALLSWAGFASALSFQGPQSDPWYLISIQIEAKSLPRGVEFRVTTFDRERITHFANAGAVPFYLGVFAASPPDWIRDLPADFVPNAMAVSGKSFRMIGSADWEPDPLPGLAISRFLKVMPGREDRVFAMEGYLGARGILVRGRYVLGNPGRLELDGPLPGGLRLHEQAHRTVIANDGPVPLYVGTKFPGPVAWKKEVPFGYLATHKLVGAKAYYAERVFPRSADGWRPVGNHDARLTWREIDGYVRGMVLKQVHEDNRPAGTTPPEPQPFELAVFHGAEKVLLRGRVTYDINPDYHPAASRYAFACHACAGRPCPECDELRRTRGRKLPERPATY